MKYPLSLLALAFYGLSAHAAAILNLAHFNQGWPSNAESIPGMPNILSVNSVGPYSFAVGLNSDSNMEAAFYNGSNWQEATSITGMKGISNIVPLYENGISPAAFALGNNQVAYFNGTTWGNAESVNGLQNIALLGSEGHMFVLSISPLQASFYNVEQQTWGAPVNLSAQLSTLRAMDAANGEAYLVGLNNSGQLTEIQSSDNQSWITQTFNITAPYLIDILATDNDVLIGTQTNEQSLLNYSVNQGHTWQSIVWPGGLLLGSINQGIVWDMNENNIAYLDLQNTNPTWVESTIPEGVGHIQTYSDPSNDGQQLCVVGGQEDGAPIELACYSKATQNWQMISSINEVAISLDQIALLKQNQIVATGADMQDKPALFYYDGATWQVAHPQGLNRLIQNLYVNANATNIWASGHN